jgi:hypothetical protein
MSDTASTALQMAVAKASADPFFLAHILSFVAPDGSLSEVARQLHCDPAKMTKLALCRCPREDAPEFRQDIEKIAGFVGCDSRALAQVVRDAAAKKALSRGNSNSASSLMAARDRLPEPPKPEKPPGGPGNG